MRDRRRVVITGIGAVTPIGHGVDGLWNGVLRGETAVRRVSRFDASPFRSQLAAEIDDFQPEDFLEPRRARRLERFSQLAIVASQQAVADSGLVPSDDSEAFGVYVGSALGGVAYGEEQHAAYVQRGVRGVSPNTALTVFGGAGACNVAMEFGINGPAMGNANSCASGTVAIGEAFRLLRDGPDASMRAVLAGGAEAPLAPLSFGAFSIIKAMSTANDEPERASRPFDARRDGFVMSEGSAILVLEDREHALARGAHLYAELLGYAHTNDAWHMTAPRPDGSQAARAIQLSLADAGLTAEHVSYVNAHGSSTPLNDATEVRAVRAALGPRATQIPVTSTKGLHGHALGASGAIETAISALAIARGYAPGTANLRDPDPACDLRHLPGEGERASIGVAITNSFGFGGINACLVLAHPDWAGR
ncbi:MAG TPA: beta-ketoacyl-[acyl-carrier-protein] synthase family protein [Thermomicrobiales bacterium]|nr:beta-ketoacyl-[acyl-carrier-protein] synthase family protein [Thermomicrobiales bacterium]